MIARKNPYLAVLSSAFAILAGCEKNTQAAAWETAGAAVLTVTAEGVQKYLCDTGTAGRLEWKFLGPQADLFDDRHQKIGTHTKVEAGPQWEIGGDTIVGTRLHERAAARTGAIPELQLGGKCTGNGATFGRVVLIERLDTEGGVAPAIEGHTPGEAAAVPYKARYVFHAAKG